MIDEILLPKEELLAGKEEHLIDSHAAFVGILRDIGLYRIDELPQTSQIAFHVSLYEGEVVNGGHEQFVANATRATALTLSELLKRVKTGLLSVGANEYLDVFERFHALLDGDAYLANAMQARGGFDHPTHGRPDDRSDQFDGELFSLRRKRPLSYYTAALIKRDPLLRTCPKSDWYGRVSALANANPLRDQRCAELKR